MKYKTFNQLKNTLDSYDIEQLTNLLTVRCKVDSINKVRYVLTHCPNGIQSWGILDRLVKNETTGLWKYIVGQEHNSEVRIIRNIILEVATKLGR